MYENYVGYSLTQYIKGKIKMKLSNIEHLAQTGTEEDVVNLLKKWGSNSWCGKYSSRDGSDHWNVTCIDAIVEGISKDQDDNRKHKKSSVVAQYGAETGPFKKTQEATTDVVTEFRETIAQLTARVAELTTLVEEKCGNAPPKKTAAQSAPPIRRHNT